MIAFFQTPEMYDWEEGMEFKFGGVFTTENWNSEKLISVSGLYCPAFHDWWEASKLEVAHALHQKLPPELSANIASFLDPNVDVGATKITALKPFKAVLRFDIGRLDWRCDAYMSVKVNGLERYRSHIQQEEETGCYTDGAQVEFEEGDVLTFSCPEINRFDSEPVHISVYKMN